MRILQFIAVLALGAIVAWLLRGWIGLFENENVGFLAWFAILLAFAGWVDWRAKRRDKKMLEALSALPQGERFDLIESEIGRSLTEAEKASVDESVRTKKPPRGDEYWWRKR